MHSAPGRLDALPAIAGGSPVRPAENRLVFGAPIVGEADIAALSECVRSRWIGLGPRVELFEREFAALKRAPFAVAVSSGTAALHLALLALGVGPGDEVIAPTMTFCSTVHAIVHAGATPVLADCDRLTFNLDPESVERRITPRTKAMIVVHMGGRCCDMDPLLEIARKHNLRVIEDCAHAIESEYCGRPAGLMGDLGCFSFYATKSITTGDGGMVITSNRRLAKRVRLLSLHGMTADAWTRSSRPSAEYGVVAAGFKANMTDLEASLGLAQLRAVEQRWKRRRELWDLYNERLEDLPLHLPAPIGPDTRHAHHLYSIVLDMEKLKVSRREFAAALHAEHVGSGIHYIPVHMHAYYRRRFGFRPSDFPNATWIGNRTLSLPIAADLSNEDVSDVAYALEKLSTYFASGGRSHAVPRRVLSPQVKKLREQSIVAEGRLADALS